MQSATSSELQSPVFHQKKTDRHTHNKRKNGKSYFHPTVAHTDFPKDIASKGAYKVDRGDTEGYYLHTGGNIGTDARGKRQFSWVCVVFDKRDRTFHPFPCSNPVQAGKVDASAWVPPAAQANT